MFESTQVLQLFPVPVWAHQLEKASTAELNPHLLREAAKLKAELPSPVPAGEGWQTRTDLHELPEFSQMIGVIRAATQGVMEMLKVAPAAVEITGCWMNMNPAGEDHGMHSHPNNFLSGVYYVNAPDGANSITFHDFRMEKHTILPRYTEDTPLTTAVARLKVRTGLLILFPSWLMHSVDPNPTDEERVSLSFNIMFSDFTSTLAKPSWDWAGMTLGSAANDD